MADQFDYGDLVARLLKVNESWSASLVRSMETRAYMLALMGQAVRAAEDLRSRGTIIDVQETSPKYGDSFQVGKNGRRVTFERKMEGGQFLVEVFRSGFPASLVPVGSALQNLETPRWSDAQHVARQQVAYEVGLLFADL